MINGIKKTVIRGPFLAQHLNPYLLPGFHIYAEKLARLQAKPGPLKLYGFLKSLKQMAKKACETMAFIAKKTGKQGKDH